MFTVCPKCALTLVVTAADLRVAQGYVRCGRCSNVFNAIAALSDDRQAAVAHEALATERSPPPREDPQDEEEYVEPELQQPEVELEFDPIATNVSDVFIEPQIGDDQETGTFEAIVLESGETDPTAPAQSGPPDADAQLEQELQTLAERIEAQNLKTPAPAEPSSGQHALRALDAGLNLAEETPDHAAEHARLWQAAIAALLVLLLLQAVHHYRHDLAVNSQLNGPLTAIYRALGVSLVPRWNVAAYEVHQLGAASSPTNEDQLIVRASLKNGAHAAQPLPLLRVAVQDRYGNRIAARDVAPESYAPRALPPRSLLAPGQRIDIEMRFMDPGNQAVGFEIDACLPRAGGDVTCANPR